MKGYFKFINMRKLLSIAIVVLFLGACSKKDEELNLTTIEDYAPLKIGKYITYSLDSLVFINVNTTEAHRFYEVKYLVADTFRDNAGRKNFKIIRYIRSNSTASFASEYTFSAINTGNGFEFIENNLRFIKLTLPLKNAYTWKGNAYLNVTATVPGYGNLNFLDDWDYTYENVDGSTPILLSGFNLPNTVTVNQKDVSINLPVTATTNIATKDFSREVYAKGIGMVYRQFIHWEYQSGVTKYNGFGVTMKMIDKN